ncbi:MAG: hypothetical protein IAE79_10965 [Anaerolinea sp.]|nr:hypothetical protein [Anaerolinea sp.]
MDGKWVRWLCLGFVVLLAACRTEAPVPTPTLMIPTAIVTITPAEPVADVLPTLPPPVTLTSAPTTIPVPTMTLPLTAASPEPMATAVSPTPTPPLTTGAPRYRVAFVEEDDVLNARSGAGVGNGIVGAFNPDAANVTITGSGELVAGSTWVPVTDGRVAGWVNGRFLTEVVAPAQFCQDADVLALLADLRTAVSRADDAMLAQLIHPERGLRIRTHWWNPEVLINGAARLALFTSGASYNWGTRDGSGEPYVGPFAREILPLLQKDLLNAAQTGCNNILSGATAGLVQLPEGYDALNFYSLYRPATDESGFDWGSWVVGVERWNGRYYLSYLVHFRWEI